MATITKSVLAANLSSHLGLSQRICEDLISKIFSNLLELIKESGEKEGGEKIEVNIKNFGKFSLSKKKARPGRNISKGTSVTIPAKQVVRFRASGTLRDKINA